VQAAGGAKNPVPDNAFDPGPYNLSKKLK
jgi:hypothetical protein